MSESYRQLVLCPQDPHWISKGLGTENENDLEPVLREVGLVDVLVDVAEKNRFYIGDQFLQHINFMGCAPAVEFIPTESGDAAQLTGFSWQQFTFVHIPPVLNEPAWYADLNMAKPQCPACNKRTALKVGQASSYFDEHKSQYCCPHCQQKTLVCNINWREFGGCARTMISIVNVYPKEAIPTESLLLQLKEKTQTAWRYFYYCGPLINSNN